MCVFCVLQYLILFINKYTQRSRLLSRHLIFFLKQEMLFKFLTIGLKIDCPTGLGEWNEAV